jgi:hypothetical protein|tara:strand:+ start:293 stop:931 length:639 start_codon:yes stop_codon:yes gene_type:complete
MEYKVIDNAMPDYVIEKWKDYYINHVRLESMRREAHKDNIPYQSTLFTFEEFVNIFDAENWLLPHAQEFESKASVAHLKRAHLNVNQTGDGFVMDGHVDISSDWKTWVDNSYYLSCLVFLNPEVHGSQHFDTGLMLGDDTVNNVFNRLVLFDGRMWHKAKVPTDNLIRLTGYWSFSNVRGIRDSSVRRQNSAVGWKRANIKLSEDQKNKWHK